MNLSCPICQSNLLSNVHTYNHAPKGEIQFSFTNQSEYKRLIYRCNICSHFISIHQMNTDSLYSGDYVSSNYKGMDGIINTFNKINALPPEKSDNYWRTKNIHEFALKYFGNTQPVKSVMDVGSGLCVFLYRMKEYGWVCTALDPDQRSAEHAKINVGVSAIHSDFMLFNDQDKKYNIITFNKVLEHVKDPVMMLKKAKNNLLPDGLVYIELPDGEVASADGFNREEFFIDHLHIFSVASLSILAQNAGFRILNLERIKEPSTKYTLRAFVTPLK